MADNSEVLADFFVNKPLYTRVSVEMPALLKHSFMAALPTYVDRECERCNKEQRWERINPATLFDQRMIDITIDSGVPPPPTQPDEFSFVTYRCRNCTYATLRVWFRFQIEESKTNPIAKVLSFTKVGHYPPRQINPPAVLKRALDEAHLALYRRGKTLRHNGYGIGALAYFRRLVEDLANGMLDLLIEMLKETGGDGDAIERVRQAKAGTVFKEKAKVAADALPASLKPGGNNPFTLLYEMPSEGLHALDDAECCAIVDRVDAALQFIYVKLKVHVDEQKAYIEALRGLNKPEKPVP